VTDTRFQLAQVNVARARGEMTEPVMAEFVAQLPEINALADQSAGFVWRLQTEDGDATAVRGLCSSWRSVTLPSLTVFTQAE
jgi:hypothetical protein